MPTHSIVGMPEHAEIFNVGLEMLPKIESSLVDVRLTNGQPVGQERRRRFLKSVLRLVGEVKTSADCPFCLNRGKFFGPRMVLEGRGSSSAARVYELSRGFLRDKLPACESAKPSLTVIELERCSGCPSMCMCDASLQVPVVKRIIAGRARHDYLMQSGVRP